ncbi:adenylyl-sulfate kinase [Pseudalkalibacillus sp. Hm43]|uniref:adenylyl-sulfate kinase n=1 Tax=Pseudalkalibacillus sp. Hm43 TaxID=3450742 RepID=UPI003F43BBFB
MGSNLFWHQQDVTKRARQLLHGHKSFVIWFTGLSGSGKSTIANKLDRSLYRKGISTYILDGDNIRIGLNNDLTFSQEDRAENIRRVGEVARLFVDAGIIVLATFVSPYRADREYVRKLMNKTEFIEVYVKCKMDTLKARDPKGLYKKAMNGEIENFTGISDPYEVPEKPDIVVDTSMMSASVCVKQIENFLFNNGYLK